MKCECYVTDTLALFWCSRVRANDDLNLGAGAGIRLPAGMGRGGQGRKRSANPHSRNASVGHLTTAGAALEICLESVFIGSVLRYATDLSLPLVSLVRGSVERD